MASSHSKSSRPGIIQPIITGIFINGAQKKISPSRMLLKGLLTLMPTRVQPHEKETVCSVWMFNFFKAKTCQTECNNEPGKKRYSKITINPFTNGNTSAKITNPKFTIIQKMKMIKRMDPSDKPVYFKKFNIQSI